MDILKVIRKIDREAKNNPSVQIFSDYVSMIREGTKNPDIIKPTVNFGKKLSTMLEKRIPKTKDLEEMKVLYYLHEQLLRVLAPYDFDSYCLYIEWDRQPKSKFYAPRRKQLKPLAEALQELYYGNLDLLCLSLPPGIGKALADDTPILTRQGWKKHGDLVVGDEVIGIDGRFKKVTHVHPKCMCDVEVTFTNGEVIRCHENHVWRFYDRATGKEVEAETKVFEKNLSHHKYYVKDDIAVKSIKRIKAVQGNCITVEGDGMYLAGRTMLPTHNSALALFFLTWWGGHIPNRSILTISHNHVFVKSAYEEIKKIIGRDSEYRYHDVFPEATIKATDALGLTIALDKTARFPTFMFGSLGSGLAGRVRAESLLFCDDLIPGIEVALSEDQLQKTWQSYTGDLLQRKISGAVELHIATRWSVRDVIGRLKMKYEDDPRAKFIEVPAMNEEGKSNFDYPFGLGYSTKALERLRSDMDEASFQALYMNEPIEREGQLYAPEDLRRYFELPDKEPDAIVSICDTKEKGEDYAFLPVAYIYGNDVYIEDCICNDGKPEVVELLLANKLMQHKVQIAQFESNSAGGKIAESIQAVIKQQGGITKITTKRTTANKETKIYANAPYVKEHFLFKDTSVIGNNREYRRMMQFLTSYSMKGKNKHDDVPDGMAMLALFLQNMMFHNVEVFTRPF